MEILRVVIPAIVILGISMLGLAITMLVKKGGKFPNTHVGGNKYLKKKGVYCSQTQDKLEQRNAYKKMNFSNMKIVTDKKTAE